MKTISTFNAYVLKCAHTVANAVAASADDGIEVECERKPLFYFEAQQISIAYSLCSSLSFVLFHHIHLFLSNFCC